MTEGPSKQQRQAAAGGRDFRVILRDLARSRSSIGGVFRDFCRVTACCLAAQTREDEYLQTIKPYTREELERLAQAMGYLIDEMDAHPFTDVLGVFYTETMAGADQTARGEFYTPQPVAELMGAVTLDIEKIKAEGKPVTVCDPCCGSGAILLSCARLLAPDHVDLLRVTLQDINPVACDMAYINTTLWGIPAEIILGNTLTMELTHRWTNLHWHRVGEPQRRQGMRMLNALRELTEPEAEPKAAPAPDPDPAKGTAGEDAQLDLF